jgi:hypothetical protein
MLFEKQRQRFGPLQKEQLKKNAAGKVIDHGHSRLDSETRVRIVG